MATVTGRLGTLQNTHLQLTREGLYDRVWSTPMVKLAAEFGKSGRGLAKLCERHKIPVPQRGYWARIQHGQRPRRPPLAETKAGEDRKIVIHPTPPPEPASPVSPQAAEAIAAEKADVNRIHVVDVLESPHRLVKQAQAALRTRKTHPYGVEPRRGDRLDIRVGPDSVDRALRIMDALVKALVGRGMRVHISDDWGTPTLVTVRGEEIRISLTEKLDRRERKLSREERRKQVRGQWFGERYVYSPSGRLALQVHGDSMRSVWRSWRDGKRRKIEDRLNDFVEGLHLAVEERQEERRQTVIRQAQWAEERARQEEEQRRRWEEQHRREQCDKEVASWAKSQQLRAYADAVRTAAIRKHGAIAPGSKLDQWLEWAIRYADSLDPSTG